MKLQYWRIEENRFACYDIYDNGHFLTTYEADLAANNSQSWANHIRRKQWAFPELVNELAMIESSFNGQ